MADVTVDSKGLARLLMSAQMKNGMRAVAQIALIEYVVDVAKRTGQLAASAEADVVVSPLTGDRWVAELRVTKEYAVWHEYGAGDGKPNATGRSPWYGPFEGAHDFTDVLNAMRGAL